MHAFSSGSHYIVALLGHLELQNFFCNLIKLGKGAVGKSQTQSRKTLSPLKKKSYYLFCPQCMTHPVLKPVHWLCRILILTLSFNYFINQNE